MIEQVYVPGLESDTILSPGYPIGYYSNTDQVRIDFCVQKVGHLTVFFSMLRTIRPALGLLVFIFNANFLQNLNMGMRI